MANGRFDSPGRLFSIVRGERVVAAELNMYATPDLATAHGEPDGGTVSVFFGMIH